eukprot:CAMPEP_0202902426 /NCGR_PEP_ID=MMETSP1392-20130828/16842_1 /ASSEMBLY_ACC=CAM_ASM_000868 /TAXON_ID=225041 /ORGANISM="Chlamydomonas chlamydogama, Strain SAG 11-48b" /LENGTH=361 /DNA_ID=CAMNT_0049589185 /DNA_START=81 /DNA_END=1168 /DNA_ORIENTATION=-
MASDELQQQQQSAGASPNSSATAKTKLFLGGLSWDTTEDKLKQYFSKYGEVDDVVVMKDRVTRTPRGFGFITFKEESAAAAACRESHIIDNRTIDAKPSVPQGESQRPRSKKIFVGGLAPETQDEEFKAYFSRFGTITEAQVMVDHNSGRSRGFGFVTFEEEEAVNKVFEIGQMHELDGKQVEVKPATPKGSGPMMSSPAGRGGGRGGGAGGRGYPSGGRGYDQYGQQGYGMGGYGVQAGYGQYGQYGQYGYGMPPYGAYTGMMMGYGGMAAALGSTGSTASRAAKTASTPTAGAGSREAAASTNKALPGAANSCNLGCCCMVLKLQGADAALAGSAEADTAAGHLPPSPAVQQHPGCVGA